ncbi:energy transducer TonB [Shewanella submarina]|uniref:Energy transducer TonB n=1 Tax=Shewanella submarina TaxID=2016376 RepID=A0ABV7G751_9GAMM|nr:energy transducer TonB [Shewanella submarina]MCL1037252.1 energy transducer TonB [Shewanella submarina]
MLKQPAMKISASELSRYWLPVSDSYQFEIDESLPAKGYVEARYLIDSEGRVHKVTFTSMTDPQWGEVVREMLAQYQYTPSAYNTKLIPVWVSNEFTLTK